MYPNNQYPPQSGQPYPPQQNYPQYNYPPQQTNSQYPPQQTQPQPQQNQWTPQQLEQYKNQLVQIHSELKQKQDLIDSLKKAGVETVEDFNAYSQNRNVQSEPQNQSSEPQNTEGDLYNTGESSKEVQELKKKIDLIERDSMQNRHLLERNNMKEQINSLIDEDNYPMLTRGLTDRIIDEVIYQRNAYYNQYKQELPIQQVLSAAESHLQREFQRLGGEIKKKPPSLDSLKSSTPKVGAGEGVAGNQAPYPLNPADNLQNQPVPGQMPPNPLNSVPNQGPGPQIPAQGSNPVSQAPGRAKNPLKPEQTGEIGFGRDRAFGEFIKSQGIEL